MAIPNNNSDVPETSPGRLQKGEWTLIVCIAVMLMAIPAYYAGLTWLRAACVYIGSAALIGAFTNRVAIHALFDPWPSRLFSLPYTGIIEMERKRIERSIMNAVAERLITPETLREELKESDALHLLRDEAAALVRSLPDGGPGWVPDGASGKGIAEAATAYSREVLERVLMNDRLLEALGTRMQEVTEEVLERPESYAMIRERFRAFAGPLGRIGHVTGVADYDEVTYRILDGVRAEMNEMWSEPERLRRLVSPWVETAERSVAGDVVLRNEMSDFAAAEFREAANRMADRLEQWDLRNSGAVDEFVDYAVQRFDIRQVVGRALNKLSTEEVKQLILKNSRDHLGWLEVWGGVLGAAGGAVLWALSPWL